MYSCTWCRKSTRPVPIAGTTLRVDGLTRLIITRRAGNAIFETQKHSKWQTDHHDGDRNRTHANGERWWRDRTPANGDCAASIQNDDASFFSHLSRSILHRKQPTPPSCQPKKLKRRGLPPPRRRSRSKRTRQRRIRERPLPRRRKLTQNGNAGEFRTIDTLMLQYHGITWTFSQPHCTSPNSYARIHRPATYLQKGVRFSEENGLIGGSSLKYLMLCRPRKWRCVNNHGNQSANELHDT